jgi:hypothetical protein
MNRITLYTYEEIKQFNNFYKQVEREGKSIYPFIYDKIEELLEEEKSKILDISALIKNLQITPGNIIHATAQLRHLDETFQVIIKADLAENALNYFPTIFDGLASLDGKAKRGKSKARKVMTGRNTLYTYVNTDQLEKILEFADQNRIPFTSSSTFLSAENNDFKERATKQKSSIIDITSLIQAIPSNPQLIF